MVGKRTQLVSAVKTETGDAVWQTVAQVWADIEQQDKSNIFSKNGIGARSAVITLPVRRNITLHNAIVCNGVHYFLTSIQSDNRVQLKLRAAVARMEQCEMERPVTEKDELKRIVQKDPLRMRFFAAVTEKYVNYTQELPQAVTQEELVLVTPKIVQLIVGDLVRREGKPYVVQKCHEMDEFKNEYEIVRKGDG